MADPGGHPFPWVAVGAVLVVGVFVAAFGIARCNGPGTERPSGQEATRGHARNDRASTPAPPGSPHADGGASASTSTKDGGAIVPATADAGPPVIPPPPPGPTVDNEVQALSPESADEVQIVATRDVGAVRYVLFRSFPGRTWRRKRKADGTWERFREATAEIEERCEDENEGNTDSVDGCVLERTPCPYLWSEHGDDPGAFAWEVAKLARRDGGWSLVGRRVLWGFAGLETVTEPPDELRANDIDRDGRPEVTAIFTFYEPDADSFLQSIWTIGVILDGGDLHTQFEVARVHASSGGDTEVTSQTREVTWRVVDADHDGVFELALREVSSSSEEPVEGEPSQSRSSRTASCPYDAAADRWVCPPLGEPLPEDRAAIADCPATPPAPPAPAADAGP